MFTYYKSAFKNAKPQNLITLIFTIIAFAVVYIASAFVRQLLTNAIMPLSLYAQFGQQVPPVMYIQIAIILLIAVLLTLFIGYQLIVGAINVMTRAIKKDKVHFTDLFFSFKKGRYLKSVVLALLTTVIFIVLMIVTSLLGMLYGKIVSPLFTQLQQSLTTNDHQLAILVTVQILVLLITSFITSIFVWATLIAMINYTVAFIENPSQKVMASFKDGFKGIKNGQKTWFKFFIGVLLVNLIILIINRPLYLLLLVATQNASQSFAQILLTTVKIITLIISIILYYVIMMGIIQYFVNRGHNDKTTNTSAKETKHPGTTQPSSKKVTNSKVENKINDTVDNNQDNKVKQSVDNNTEKVKDDVSSTKDDIIDNHKQ
ncbi:YtxH domain-containing protein [Staphylococcus simiae]|uniref:YtxH domain-containing protein n=1 Tax=Staphylococcus simiae TaxID=308354 RepID=UPI001A959F18|nr:YtxH domain-containing protein [Staphylococcus simiae]MBO1199141.1 YtxH domain-containing protein [Staphylococcus simiae]MBO1201342.1 YtxH domain-containing protein [Staphylococcus simiae]MBO1203490.1 YtxH domain-containing protein [Staphylococcus simiae]MBO1211018.1 YtxH domain-containing protein [Staphylococcus simiae]MBO1229702.1 YtxH domain-containing protein [Staphylococcus simiae]